jgi:hypothetical protein
MGDDRTADCTASGSFCVAIPGFPHHITPPSAPKSIALDRLSDSGPERLRG